jgi:hypothetical protein
VLRATGTRPAVLLATSKLGDPRGLAIAMLRHHQVTAVGLAILAAVAVVVAIRG